LFYIHVKFLESVKAAANGQVLLQVGYFITSSPEPLPNRKYEVEVNNKKLNRYSSARTKVQRCKQPKFQCPAPLAAILLLHAVFLREFDAACVLKCKVSIQKIFSVCFKM